MDFKQKENPTSAGNAFAWQRCLRKWDCFLFCGHRNCSNCSILSCSQRLRSDEVTCC